jgi:hypothetical protein
LASAEDRISTRKDKWLSLDGAKATGRAAGRTLSLRPVGNSGSPPAIGFGADRTPGQGRRSEIRDAPERDHAEQDIEAFARDYGVTWPRSVAKIIDEAKALLCFCDFPAEHLLHLRTSNPIRSN